MAIGIRILSDNLSGLTTNVTFLPQSGGTISLGTQVFPFNYISDYVYGTYNCYVPTYGYIYSLDVLGPTPTPTTTTTPTNTPTTTTTPTNTPTTTTTPTQTPTNTETPTQTPTNTETPTQTPTNTPTPTEPIRYVFNTICHSEFDSGSVCECPQVATIWGNNPVFSASTAFFSDPSGPNTGNPGGWYLVDGIEYELSNDCGIGCTTGATIVATSVCPVTLTPTPTNTETPTQTPTPTNTETPTQTPTNTETPTQTPTNTETPTQTPTNSETPTQTPTNTSTPTQTPTETIGYYTYSLGYDGSVALSACTDPSPINVYAPISGGIGPNVGETLYANSGLTVTVPDGYYSNGTAWYLVSGGSGLITSDDPNGCT